MLNGIKFRISIDPLVDNLNFSSKSEICCIYNLIYVISHFFQMQVDVPVI